MEKLDVSARLEEMKETIGKISHSRSHIYEPKDLAAKAADIITGFVGSWLFVGIHALWFVLWILFRVEAFPFGLLTLLVSLEAIFLSTFVMMSQNRSAERDHVRDDHEAQEVDALYQINQTQLEILELLRKSTRLQDGSKAPASVTAGNTTTVAAGLSLPERSKVATPAGTPSRRKRR